MQIFAIVIALAVAGQGSDGYYFTDLLKIISRNASITPDMLDLSESPEDYEAPANPTLNSSNVILNSQSVVVFCPITMPGQHKAEPGNADNYPWLARLVHSRNKNAPFMCTAAAVTDQVFVTAGRCTTTAKCGYVSVLYNNLRLACLAFVHPTQPTKQWFDDWSVVLVHNREGTHYYTVPLFDQKRPPAHFDFLDAWRVNKPTNKVVGYLADPRNPARHRLYELNNVYVSNHLCNRITRNRRATGDYYVPCYHSCSARQHAARPRADACEPRLAGLGLLVLDQRGLLLGAATWTCDRTDFSSRPYTLPVGIAIVNSISFVAQMECASRILQDTMGYIDSETPLQAYCSAINV